MILVLTFIHISFSFAALHVLFLGYSKIACIFFDSWFFFFFLSLSIEHRHVKFVLFLLRIIFIHDTRSPCTLMPYHVSRTYFDNSFLSSENIDINSIFHQSSLYFHRCIVGWLKIIDKIKVTWTFGTCQNTFCGTHTCRMVCWCT